MGGEFVKISGAPGSDGSTALVGADPVRRGGTTLLQLGQLQLPGLLASSRSSSQAQRSVSSAVTEFGM
jgi:hypothetical protein